MKKLLVSLISAVALCACLFVAGCGGGSANGGAGSEPASTNSGLAEGTYTAQFTSDLMSMIHLNEVCDGRCTLTVDADGNAVAHLIMPSTSIRKLYLGTKDEAQKPGAELIEATEEKVRYDDGYKQTVSAFDLPVPVIDQEFDMALVGKKGKWYDHKVKFTDVQPK